MLQKDKWAILVQNAHLSFSSSNFRDRSKLIVRSDFRTTRWAYHAKNSSWYTLLKYSSPSMVHHIFENYDSKMVVVPSRLWLPLFHPRLSGAVLAQGPWTQCYKLAPQPAVPNRFRKETHVSWIPKIPSCWHQKLDPSGHARFDPTWHKKSHPSDPKILSLRHKELGHVCITCMTWDWSKYPSDREILCRTE